MSRTTAVADAAPRRELVEASPELLGQERHERVQQAQRLVEHRREHLLRVRRAAAAPSFMRGFTSSRYQSQSSFQKKSRLAPIAADGL
jgi:hypothetical protein